MLAEPTTQRSSRANTKVSTEGIVISGLYALS